MREIEFRGKKENDEKWLYGDLSYGGPENNHKKFASINIWEDGLKVGYVVKQETIGQYTGLKDKNGKMIYEGDIIKFIYENKEKIRAIVFEKGEFLAKDDTTAFGPTFRHIRLCSNIEVIGNIYDNPESLKVAAQEGHQETMLPAAE